MTALIHQRCWNHESREAVAKCIVCSRYFCRECVTERDGRMTCAACAARAATVSEAAKFNGGLWGLAAAAGFLLAWMFFYYLGGLLARIPSDFFDKS